MTALGDVRQVARDPVADADAIGGERRGERAHLGLQRGPATARAGCRPRRRRSAPALASSRRSRFSAKFSRAPSNQRAPGIFSPSASTRSALRLALTPPSSHTSCQNAAGCSTDQRQSCWTASRPRSRACGRAAAIWVAAAASGRGCQSTGFMPASAAGRRSSARASATVAGRRPYSGQSSTTRSTSAAFEGASALAVEAHVVLEPGAAMAAELERPVVERDLVLADPGPGPGRIRCQALERRDVELEGRAVDRHRVLDAHHELDVQRRLDLPGSAPSRPP